MSRICQRCGSSVEDGLTFCDTCGFVFSKDDISNNSSDNPMEPSSHAASDKKDVKNINTCPNCGSDFDMHIGICITCGYKPGDPIVRLSSSNEQCEKKPDSSIKTSGTVVPPKQKNYWKVLAIGFIVVLALYGIYSFLISIPSNKNTVADIEENNTSVEQSELETQDKEITSNQTQNTDAEKASETLNELASEEFDPGSSDTVSKNQNKTIEEDTSHIQETDNKKIEEDTSSSEQEPTVEEQENDNSSNDHEIKGIGDTGEYILPDSDIKLYSETELSSFSDEELLYAKNEILARHGYIFDDNELNDYFSTKDWYTPEITVLSTNDLNKIEFENILTIEKIERER